MRRVRFTQGLVKGDGSQACENTTFLDPPFLEPPRLVCSQGLPLWLHLWNCSCRGSRTRPKERQRVGIDDFEWANGGFGIDQELALKQCADRMFMHSLIIVNESHIIANLHTNKRFQTLAAWPYHSFLEFFFGKVRAKRKQTKAFQAAWNSICFIYAIL